MPLRDVLIKLRLDDSQFRAKMAAAAASTKTFGANTVAAGQQGAKSLGLLKSNYATIGLVAGAAGVAFVKSGAQFEQAMANVNATGAATKAELAALEKQALDFGRTTVYSATEAAGGIEALLKAGLSARDVMGKQGGLAASLDLAAASNLDVAQSAEAVSIAMQQFDLAGQQAAHVSDLLAAGAGKSVGEVSDLSMALNQSGLVARQAGLSIEETVGTLSQFAAAGLIGSDAGTSFKTMLQRLVKPAAEAEGLIAKYNLSAYDAQGNFIGMAKYAGKLHDGLKDLSVEQRQATLATVFGSDAVRAASVIYEGGAKDSAKWTTAVTDAGYAADVASKKTDTLTGDLDKMKNSWRALAEGSGGGSGGLRPFVQGLDDIADALGRIGKVIPDPLSDSGNPFGIFGDLFNRGRLGTFARENGLELEALLKFKTEGAPNAIRDAAAVARAANLTPKQVTTVLDMIGWSPEKIDLVLEKMNQVHEKRVTALVDILGVPEALAELGIVNTAADNTDSKNPKIDVAVENAPPSIKVLYDVAGVAEEVDKTDPHVTVTADTDDAMDKISAFRQALASLSNQDSYGVLQYRPADGGAILGFASGGRARGAIRGPGGPRQDSIPARLSNGEHVLTASDVRKAGGQEAVYKMRADIQAGRLRFAAGGPVREFAAGGAVSGSGSGSAAAVQISFRDFSFDVATLAASVTAVATDAAGRVLDEASFKSQMRATA